MAQLHKKFSGEQIKAIFRNYCSGHISRAAVEELLEIGKSRFFVLLNKYRNFPDSPMIAYTRNTPGRISVEHEDIIRQELNREKALVDDKRLPISSYNYSALRDRLQDKGIRVSVPTIIKRAKEQDCYIPHRKKKAHDRQVITSAIGELIQHDASLHLWSPLASEKWTLITSLDDYSRKILFADFFSRETTWAHIQAAQAVLVKNGLPARYFVDNLRVFRFVQNRDSYWRKHVLETDDADPQWRQVMNSLHVAVTYALSPQAKGKIERPFRWLQDRIVRTCALDHISTQDEARQVLMAEIDRYNNHQLHSTTGEIPAIRFEKALSMGNSLFRLFVFPKPFSSLKDVFCLRDTRMLNGYRRISLGGQEFEIPHVPAYEHVDLHLTPLNDDQVEVRVWYDRKFVHTLTIAAYKLKGVHF
ncbi:MAG: hypothetical protein MUO42_05170 [Anaerolineaceae bacterium]|nr:hypothetical protein [Anaerolineaceae bacterium]